MIHPPLLPQYLICIYILQIYSGITSGRVLDGELLYTEILEVNLFEFTYRLLHEDFSPIYGVFKKNFHSYDISNNQYMSLSSRYTH